MKNTNTKTLRRTLKSLAFAVGLAATANSASYAIPVKEAKKAEATNHNHDHKSETEITVEKLITKVNAEKTSVVETITESKYEKIKINEVKRGSVVDYKGYSIVDALNMSGVDYSFSNRKIMATNLGIKNYRGTAAQNILLLNTIKENKMESLVKVSDIKSMCKKLFGKNSQTVIRNLNLPKTYNLSKQEFARIIKQIATNLNVDTTTYDNRLNYVINAIGDINETTINNGDIAWAYYMGYVDIDDNLNFNGNNPVTVNEFNAWASSFTYDYNLSVENNSINGNGLVIKPSQDKFDRDQLDKSGINDIRNNNMNNKPSNNNNNQPKPEKHTHQFGNWQYYDQDKESNTCQECGEVKYRKHKFDKNPEITFESNNDQTHNVISTSHCDGCNFDLKTTYIVHCDLGTWVYNRETGLEERDCDDCGYEETKEHIHGQAPAQLVYKLDKSNNNGTHKLVASYDCEVCNETLNLYKDENCELGTYEYNPETGLEERDCDVCGYEETKEHIHSEKPAQLTYVFNKTNNDGTHELKAEYECEVCNETFTSYKNENCDLGEFIYNQETGLEERDCDICGYEETKEHIHSEKPSDSELTYVFNKTNNDGTHELKAEYECEVCNETFTSYKNENCELGTYEYNPETRLEERNCDICGYKETKEHIHSEVPADLVYTFNKTNNDGTHELKAEYSCEVCNETFTSYKNENCELGEFVYNPETGLEERDCDVCGYEETKEHIHSEKPSDSELTYVFNKTNNDGTHELKAEYECEVCGEIITLYKNENCEYSDWQTNDDSTCKKECEVCEHTVVKYHEFEAMENSVTSNATVGKHNIMEKCDDCGYEKQAEVSCVSDGNKYYYVNGEIVTERENCSICHDVCIDTPHNHAYGEYQSADDTNHKRVCDCGHESIEAHDYSEWNITDNGQNTRVCGICNHTQSVSHTCNLSSHNEFPATQTADYCYEIVTECTIDGCNHETRVPVGHNYYVESNMFGAVYTCDNCGFSYEEDFDLAFLSLENNNTSYAYLKEEEEKSKQLVLK